MDLPSHFGPYQLVKKIASGGMAEIFLARMGGIQGFEKNLVLKMIHPKWSQDTEFVSMLIEEAKLAVQLTHNNIAQIFDLGLQNDVYYIAMEYVDGKDLFQLLVRTSEIETYLPFDVTAYLIEQAAAALHYAHSRLDPYGRNIGLIHRDISPQNILVSYNGEVKLIDFGIAKASMREGHTQAGVIKGKFYYMSPEQAFGRPLDHRTDIFSLGICLHEMLTGQMLYAEENQLRLLEIVRQANIPRPSRLRQGVPPELEAIAMRALEPDPNQRFQSAFDLQRALAEYLHRHAPGFTPNRCARLMWDLFPNDNPHSRQQATAPVDRRDFASAAPPDSVIFDLNQLGGAPAAPPQPPGRRSSTRQVDALQAPPEEDIFTGDGLGSHYPSTPTAPPPPGGLEFHESTQIVDWQRYKERHPERPAPSPGLPPMPPPVPGAPLTFDSDGPTNLFDPSILQQAPPSSAPMSMDEATHFFTRRPDGSLGAPPAPSPEDALEFTAPARPSALAKALGRPVKPPEDEATVEGSIPALLAPNPPPPLPPPPGGGPSLADKVAAAKARKAGGAPPPPQEAAPALPKPPGGNDLASKIKKKPKGDAPAAQADAPALSIEEKIAAAKARKAAAGGEGPKPPGGGNDLASKIKKKPKGDAPAPQDDASPGGDDPADKIAAAKAKARAKAGGGASSGRGPNIVKGSKGNVGAGNMDHLKVAGRGPSGGGGPAKWIALAIGAAIVVLGLGGFGAYKIIAAASTPDVGSIAISSVPNGAEIYYDGNPLGVQTPYTIENVPGNTAHLLRVTLKDYEDEIKSGVMVVPGQIEQVHFTLQPTPGTLVISSEPSEASVLINGEPRGTTTANIQGLPRVAGTFLQVELQKEGYKPRTINLQWQPGETMLTHHEVLEKVQ